MFCRKCGAKLVEGDSFCGSCGAPVVKKEKKPEEKVEEKKEEIVENKIEEPKLISDDPLEEKQESLVDFLSKDKPGKPHLQLPEEEEKDFGNLLEAPKTNLGASDNSIQMDEAKENLVDLVIEEKPKTTPKVVEETEKDNVFTRNDNAAHSTNNNLVTFNENPKKQSPVLAIVLGIVGFIAGYIVVSMLFGNNPFNKYMNNNGTGKKTDEAVEEVKYEKKQLGELKYEMPTNFRIYSEKPQYTIYTTVDEVCMISVVTTPVATHTSTDALIETSLTASNNAVNGKMLPYTTSKRKYNSIPWTHASTTITAQGVNLYESVYAVEKNGNYYSVTFQSQGYDQDCNHYQAKIIRSAKFE